MNIVVLLKMVPDVVEELLIAPDGKMLDADYVRTILSERDDHALEEALLLKERHGGTVIVVAPDAPEVDDALYTALAKGADRAIKITDVEAVVGTRALARICANALTDIPNLLPADLILTGVQTIDDLDGQLAPLLAHSLHLPYVGIVNQITVDLNTRAATIFKEYPGGVRGEFELPLPAVLGIQSAEKTPRYVIVNKVMQVIKTKKIETVTAPVFDSTPLVEILELKKPQTTGRAEMLEGSPEELAQKVYAVLAERSLV